jgi:hypothetical protein
MPISAEVPSKVTYRHVIASARIRSIAPSTRFQSALSTIIGSVPLVPG